LQIAQGNQTSAPIQINISDLPALSDLGLQPGQMSQAFNSYQTLAFASSINLHQAVGLLPTASGVPGALLTNLQTQLLATINARNVVDNIVANPGYSLPLGTASDGTAISFDATSASVLDRILAQYLAALTNQSAVNLSASVRQARGATSKRVIAPTISINQTFRSRSDRAQHADSHGVPAGLSTFVNTISTLGGAANIFSTGQTLLSGNSSTADKVLSVASTALSVVTIGATLVAATAAAPEIAAGAVAVAAWSALAGVGVGAAMVGNDVYNVATNYSDYLNSVPGSPSANLALKNAESAATNFVADSISTLLNASGIGAVESALTHSVTPAELSILGQALVPAADDVASGLKGLLTSTANIWAQSQFDDDINNAKANIGQGPLATPPTGDFTIVDGMVTISNANGPILSPLPGVEVNSSTTDGLLTTIGDVNGDYSLCVPLGSSSIPYSSTDISAYDPISGTVLGSTTVDLSNVSPDQTITGPSLTGTCTDTDATTPDGDDPDCD
jgi:hypothetical protein